MITRYFINLCFKGTNYHGWQQQPNAMSVQQIINQALSTIIRDKISTIGAGRTDTGVHAKFFTAHFDTNFSDLEDRKDSILKQLNGLLPVDIAVLDLLKVAKNAHARFSAISRTYEYTISKRKDPFLFEFTWYYPVNLDFQKMNEACHLLLNQNNFASFGKLHSNLKTHICRIYQAFWVSIEEKAIFTIKADRFLRDMVRAIVGTLVNLGRGKIDQSDFLNIINSKDRNQAGASVPACGLSLTKIEYTAEVFDKC